MFKIFIIQANKTAEVRLKFMPPPTGEVRCRVDIIIEQTKNVEESLLFKIKTIE